MPFTHDDRLAFADLLDELDTEATATFLEARAHVLVDEAAAVPGVDQVRAGLVRAARLHARPERPAIEAAARDALQTFPDTVASAPPTLLQRRHPAWVGLCALEVGHDLDEAIALARVGFESLAGPQEAGDILWAMAEAADEVAWSATHRALLEAAVVSPFRHRDQHDQVRLLWALERVGSDPASLDELDALARDDDADDRARVHALWVLSAVAREAGDTAQVRERLEAALGLVDAESEPEIAQRIEAALAEA